MDEHYYHNLKKVLFLIHDLGQGGAEKVYGLKEGGVGIVENTKNLIPQDVMDYVNKEADKIKNGEYVENKEKYKCGKVCGKCG